MKWIIVLFFSISSIHCYASKINIKIIVHDSINKMDVNGFYVNCNRKLALYSGDYSNTVSFELECNTKKMHNIFVSKNGYEEVKIRLYLNYDCKDTVIVLNLLKIFYNRELPIFYFEKFSFNPDTSLLDKKLHILKEILKPQKNLIIVIEGYCDYDELKSNDFDLALKRAVYLKGLLLKLGLNNENIDIQNKGYLPYIIRYKEDFQYPFSYLDTLNQNYIIKLSYRVKKKAERYNRRVEISFKLKE